MVGVLSSKGSMRMVNPEAQNEETLVGDTERPPPAEKAQSSCPAGSGRASLSQQWPPRSSGEP